MENVPQSFSGLTKLDFKIQYFIFKRHLKIQNNFLIFKNLKFKDIYS